MFCDERSHDSSGVPLDKRVEKILELMKADVRGELTLTEFAHSVNLSVWRLSHIFKSDVGMPPIKYLKVLRMERAKELLESSFLSVKEIAFQVGLSDESHFVRDFKATYGLSPTCYRAQFKLNGANGNGTNGNGGAHENGNGNAADHATVDQQPSKQFTYEISAALTRLPATQPAPPAPSAALTARATSTWTSFRSTPSATYFWPARTTRRRPGTR
jgi:AraC-like DNA-binding protein